MRRILAVFLCLAILPVTLFAQPTPWSEQRAAGWYARQPCDVGSNYIPATAVNQLEMERKAFAVAVLDPAAARRRVGRAYGCGGGQ